MWSKTFFIGLFICQISYLGAMDKPSIYDPLGTLSPEERNRIEAEGRNIITNRKVNGQDLLIQIDFLSNNEFDEGGVTGRDESGRTLFSLGTYSNWSVKYFSRPAVLILFLDLGNGNYVLDALNFSDMLMDEGIPDLVRRYIRDEIMKKETSYVETISSGLYAIGEALNPVYRQRLEQKGKEMLNRDDRYQRAHCNQWFECKYYNYYPIERLKSNFPENINFNELGFFIEAPSDYKVTNLVDNTQNKILDWGYTHTSEAVSNWPWEKNGRYLKTSLNTSGYTIPGDYFLLKNSGDTLSFFNVEEEQKNNGDILPVMGYLQIHGWKATYCNFFAYDLSRHIFGYVPWERPKRANDIHDYISSSGDFYKISEVEDIRVFKEAGFMIYLTIKNSPNSGHIATAWINDNEIIQAGSETGIMSIDEGFGPEVKVNMHVYLGHLKRRL